MMKLSYSIGLEDFRALRPPLTGRAGHNAGFKGVLVVCFLMALLGIFTITQGMGMLTSGFLIGLGVLVALISYLFDKRSVRSAKEKHDRGISTAYQVLRCADQRSFEADDKGFTISSGSGTLTRPWSELTRLSETPQIFFLSTKSEGQVIPKSAFQSEGEITEFRTLVLEKLNQDRALTSRPIDFTYAPRDFRAAYFVHIFKAGGWRNLLKTAAVFCASVYGAIAIWIYFSPHRDPAVLCGITGALLAGPVIRISRIRRRRSQGPFRFYFSEDALHVQELATQSRIPWKQFIGYLEGDRSFLLYKGVRNYTVVPKRALGSQESEFRELVGKKLQLFNYRSPLPVILPNVPAGSGLPS